MPKIMVYQWPCAYLINNFIVLLNVVSCNIFFFFFHFISYFPFPEKAMWYKTWEKINALTPATHYFDDLDSLVLNTMRKFIP